MLLNRWRDLQYIFFYLCRRDCGEFLFLSSGRSHCFRGDWLKTGNLWDIWGTDIELIVTLFDGCFVFHEHGVELSLDFVILFYRLHDGDSLLLLAFGWYGIYLVFGKLVLYLTFEYFPLYISLFEQFFALLLCDPH